jgi:hypothetical protein
MLFFVGSSLISPVDECAEATAYRRSERTY